MSAVEKLESSKPPFAMDFEVDETNTVNKVILEYNLQNDMNVQLSIAQSLVGGSKGFQFGVSPESTDSNEKSDELPSYINLNIAGEVTNFINLNVRAEESDSQLALLDRKLTKLGSPEDSSQIKEAIFALQKAFEEHSNQIFGEGMANSAKELPALKDIERANSQYFNMDGIDGP